ncbi:OstA-like protein [Mucilaginibacter sp. OK098]|uniref:OstA-like protein n=1 Tax=Mucilaginibacter sp. OK098 TaxID=1855297 RepID=UPI00091AE349|nr:OstA-like protein [Mucilaginibacter sp. OK098]SHN35463.1 OstA-like protein [Mucilaginibacter sp. OK098]
MRKYVLSVFLLLIAVAAMCQKKSVVNLIKSKESYGVKINGKDLVKVYQGTFRQDFSTLTSDSAYFYVQENLVDAFGHVVINQGDTLNIYSDKLHYDGNTKIALLTDNVKMVDKDAVLTTNHLNYNTATRIGTYVDGGKLVNKDNTLLSKNGYYFAFSHDSYFRYDVSLTTPDALIKTDTMRYNTKDKISYFYGPTHIYGIKKEKDKKDNDTLYTENGTYNTVVEQAAFGKNNLYTSGTKSLKGDSLFYDKLKGYGRAVKHVTFTDREQKTTIKGDLGTYYKAEERTVMTQDPYIIIVTEQKDTTNADSVAKADSVRKADSLFRINPEKNKSTMNMARLIMQTIPGKTDSVVNTRKYNPALLKDGKSKIDSVLKKLPVDTNALHKKIDSVIKKPPVDMKNINLKTVQAQIIPGKSKAKDTKKQDSSPLVRGQPKNIKEPRAVKDTSHIKRDSVYMSADTIETQILTYKDLKIYQEKQRLAHIRDTTAKPKAKKPDSKFLTGQLAGVPLDTTFHHREFFGKPKPKAKKPPIVISKKQLAADSVRKKRLDDSITIAKKLEPSDTARIRIVIAHHNFKLFKSDMQAKSDSMFYSNSDSTIRCFVNPLIWTEGSQLSGDTIYLQMKHKKMDNMTMFPHALIVNIEKGDSVHFNQIAGKKMRGYFKDDKLHRMFIDGNAESIYFARDSGKTEVSGMERSLSTRIRVDFEKNQATNIGFYLKPEHKYTPIAKVVDDDKILKGFIWKPKERPVSKESIIPSFTKKAAAKAAKDKAKAGKVTDKKLPDGKTVKDSTGSSPPKPPGIKTVKDSLNKMPAKLPGIKAAADSLNKALSKSPLLKAVKDSLLKTTPTKLPAVKDSVGVKPGVVKKPGNPNN